MDKKQDIISINIKTTRKIISPTSPLCYAQGEDIEHNIECKMALLVGGRDDKFIGALTQTFAAMPDEFFIERYGNRGLVVIDYRE